MKQTVHAVYRGERDHWWFRARRAIFAAILDRAAPLPSGARILDLGPGHGVNGSILQPRGRWIALDVARDSLDGCRAGGALALQSDAARVAAKDGAFDLVCALDVLEHLDDDATALAEWRRVTRAGGRLLLSVPAFSFLWGRQDVLSEHRRRYTRPRLRALVERAGFEIERLTYFNTLLFPPIALVRLLMRPFLRASVARGGSDLSMPLPIVDRLLYASFAVERHWLVRADLPVGVSLLCVARPRG